MELIPTRLKEKLPVGFSYPVGAETLSVSLRDAPCFDQLELWFSWKDHYWASDYREKLQSQGSIVVIDVNHYRGFSIWLHSVPRSHANLARELIRAQALPSLAQALRSSSAEAEGIRWSASFDLASSALSINAVEPSASRGQVRRFRAPVRPRVR
jgi:hypothetical protein